MNRSDWPQNMETATGSPIVPSPIKEITDRDVPAARSPLPSGLARGKDEVVAKVKSAISSAPAALKSTFDNLPHAIDERPYVFLGIGGGLAFGAGLLFGSKVVRWATLLGAGLAVSLLASSRFGEQAQTLVRDQARKLTAKK